MSALQIRNAIFHEPQSQSYYFPTAKEVFFKNIFKKYLPPVQNYKRLSFMEYFIIIISCNFP